jgi:hypothetical protein
VTARVPRIVTWGARSSFFGTINQVFRCVSDLAGARPLPPSTAKIKPRWSPPAGFRFSGEGAARALAEPDLPERRYLFLAEPAPLAVP